MLIHILFFENFLCCVKIWCYNIYIYIYIYILERLGRIHENKIFFENLTKTDYFNTGFVSLQYKNTNRYWSKYSNKITENHIFWNNFFWRIFVRAGQTRPKRKLGQNRPEINWGLVSTGLDSAQPKTTWLVTVHCTHSAGEQ